MAILTEDAVVAALRTVGDPDRGQDIVSLGMVSGLQVRDGHVAFSIEVDTARGAKLEPVRKAAEKAVHELPGALTVTAVLTAERAPPAQPPQKEAAPQPQGRAHGHGAAAAKEMLPHVGAVVAVASGKGGVGKSTTAVNLALALAANGHSAGILDADIYGPSVPRLLGAKGKPETNQDKRIKPMKSHGISCMSIGFFVDEETPMIWRGPMATGALEQLLTDVEWGELDVLVVDLPPGTGDIHLSMAQRVPLSGAVIVSTPQDISLLDARKGLNMFRKVDVPVLGLIENMSYFLCPHCGERSDIFSHGGARREAERLGVPFLGEVPLDIVIRETSDGGNPIVVSDPASPYAKVYREIARQVWDAVGADRAASAGPKIVIQ
jgi:ATP-binding protein involved in chromosome partitioning